MNLSYWMSAFRLRTLFLSLSCIAGGIISAQTQLSINPQIAGFTLLTALFLQILSNLANDYGDSIHGADHSGRKGPQRAVQSGKISKEKMKSAIVVLSVLSLLSGIVLLYLSVDTIGINGAVILFIIGLLSIAAAIAYTNGKKPYGYVGLGDVSVFIFFGLTAVMGAYFLQTGTFANYNTFCLSVAYGLLSVGVLNINNMRDIESDQTAGKYSIPVRLGLANAKIYHYALLGLAALCISVFIIKTEMNLLVLLPVYALLMLNARAAYKAQSHTFDPLLKYLSLSTFLITLMLYIGLYI